MTCCHQMLPWCVVMVCSHMILLWDSAMTCDPDWLPEASPITWWHVWSPWLASENWILQVFPSNAVMRCCMNCSYVVYPCPVVIEGFMIFCQEVLPWNPAMVRYRTMPSWGAAAACSHLQKQSLPEGKTPSSVNMEERKNGLCFSRQFENV